MATLSIFSWPKIPHPMILKGAEEMFSPESVETLREGGRLTIGDCALSDSIATASIAPDFLVVGAPAPFSRPRQRLHLAWFGHSIMEHLEVRNSRMHLQSTLPPVGSFVEVEEWSNGGYPEALRLALQAKMPQIDFDWKNYARGGATSRDICQLVERALREAPEPIDVAFHGAGINDVWRRFQGRTEEAVDANEFRANYRASLRMLSDRSRHVVCIGDTPLGWDDDVDIEAINTEIQRYNTIAAQEATAVKAHFVDVYGPFTGALRQLQWSTKDGPSERSLWSDGAHLSALGDVLVGGVVRDYLDSADIVTSCTVYAK